MESFHARQCRVLEGMARGEPLPLVLESIVKLIEDEVPGMMCSILLLDAKRGALHCGSAPSLPAEYIKALEGALIGPTEGSCGAAAATGLRVIVEDIATHPSWVKYRDLALPHGLRACWSTPIFSSTREVLGTYAMYYREPRAPRAEEIELVDAATHLSAIALEHERSETALRRSAERLALLHHLGDTMREVESADDVLQMALAMLGKHLGVSRCAYGNIDADGDRIEIPCDYADNCPSMVGQQYLSDFGPMLTHEFRRGIAPVVVRDAEAELRPEDGAQRLAALGIRAFICCSLVRAGKLRAIMAVTQDRPRDFRQDEIELVQEFVERCWSHIEQRGAEAKLRANEALLGIATRAAKLGAWSLDLPERRVTWSDEVCAIYGVPPGTVPTFEQALAGYSPELRAVALEALEACARDGTPFDLELPLTTNDRRRLWVRAIGRAQRSRDGAITRLQGAFQDVSERRELEEQLSHSQKMEAIGKLAGGIAHDFNNLLTVILGYGSLLRDKVGSDALRAEVEQIFTAGQRAKELTQQLLAFSRQQVLHPRVLDLNEIVAEVNTMLRRMLGEDITVSFTRASDLGHVLADPGQMQQVVLNLVVNARDAMPRGGHLSLETANVVVDEAYGGRHGLALGKYVRLSVSDNGTGMDAATRARVFEPFFTTKEQGKGTGLGLSMAWGIITQSGGHIDVASELGVGTTFRVYLPRVDHRIEQARASEAPMSLRGAETILVVEDQDQVRALLQTVLERAGYRVLSAQNGGEALLICEQHKASIDLLLTDVVMPRMSGRELADRLALLRPGMRVIYLSGYADNSVVPHNVPDGNIAFVAKPPTPDALLRKVREILNAPR